jgi:hypothetical protein
MRYFGEDFFWAKVKLNDKRNVVAANNTFDKFVLNYSSSEVIMFASRS